MPDHSAKQRNPLGFYVSPNGTDPHYSTEFSFERFVAFAFLASYQHLHGPGTEKLHPEPNHLMELRGSFLAEVQLAIEAMPTLKEEAGDVRPHSLLYLGDHPSPTLEIACDGETTLQMRWRFERLDLGAEAEDNCLLFVLDWGEDDFSIWLAVSAVQKPKEVQRVLKQAANAAIKAVVGKL